MASKRYVAVALVLSSSSVALADDDKAACLEAASRGQTLRDEHALVEAREQFRLCARATCPAVVQRDCAGWLDGVEHALPTVVFSAKDDAGNDLVNVKLSVDGKLMSTTLDGHAVPMNPGAHNVHFEGDDGATVDREVVVKEGETNQGVAVVFKRAEAASVAVAPAIRELPQKKEPGADAWMTTGYVLGGVGLVALGVGTVFGLVAIADKNSAACDSSNTCAPGPLSDAWTAATASTIGIISGVVLLATGVTIAVVAPRLRHKSVSLAAPLALRF